MEAATELCRECKDGLRLICTSLSKYFEFS